MPYDFFDIYDEFRQSNVPANFSVLYEEWKRRNHIYFPSVAPPLVVVREAPRFGSLECCSLYDGTGILPGIFIVWYICRRLIHWWYEPEADNENSLWSCFTMTEEENAT